MVADGGGIVAHLIHQPDLDLSLEEGVVTRALREVAAVDEQQSGVELTLLLHHVDATQEAAPASQILVVDVGIDGQYGGMGIIGMQDDKLFVLPCTSLTG